MYPWFKDSLEDSDSGRWGVNICKGTNLEWFYMGSSVCPEHLVFWNLKLQSTEILNWRYAHNYSMLKPSSFSSHWSFIIEWKHIVTCWIWWSSYIVICCFLKISVLLCSSFVFFCFPTDPSGRSMARTCPRINAPSRSCVVRPSLGDIKTWTEVNCSRMLMSSMSSFYLRTWSVGKHRASWNADMSIKVQVLYGFIISKSFELEITIRFIKSESPPFLRKKSSVGTSHPQVLLQVEKTKRALSSTHQARLEIEALYDGVDFSETLTRARFEAPLSWSWWSTCWKM